MQQFLKRCDLFPAKDQGGRFLRSSWGGLLHCAFLPLLVVYFIFVMVPICKPIESCCICSSDPWIESAFTPNCLKSSTCIEQVNDNITRICLGLQDSYTYTVKTQFVSCPGVDEGDTCDKDCLDLSFKWSKSNYYTSLNIQQKFRQCNNTGICNIVSDEAICNYPTLSQTITYLGAGFGFLIGAIVLRSSGASLMQRIKDRNQPKGTWKEFLGGMLVVSVLNYFGYLYLLFANGVTKRMRYGGQMSLLFQLYFLTPFLFVTTTRALSRSTWQPLLITLIARVAIIYCFFLTIYNLLQLKHISLKNNAHDLKNNYGQNNHKEPLFSSSSDNLTKGSTKTSYSSLAEVMPKAHGSFTDSVPSPAWKKTKSSPRILRWFSLGLLFNIAAVPISYLFPRVFKVKKIRGLFEGCLVNVSIVMMTGVWVFLCVTGYYNEISFLYPLRVPDNAYILASGQGLYQLTEILTLGTFSFALGSLLIRLGPFVGQIQEEKIAIRHTLFEDNQYEIGFFLGSLPLIGEGAAFCWYLHHVSTTQLPVTDQSECHNVEFGWMWSLGMLPGLILSVLLRREKMRWGALVSTGLGLIIFGESAQIIMMGYCQQIMFPSGYLFLPYIFVALGGFLILYQPIRHSFYYISNRPTSSKPITLPGTSPQVPTSITSIQRFNFDLPRRVEPSSGIYEFPHSKSFSGDPGDEVDDPCEDEESYLIRASVSASSSTSSFSGVATVQPLDLSPPTSFNGNESSVPRSTKKPSIKSMVGSPKPSSGGFESKYVSFEYTPLLSNPPP